ncbi:hypothetical protein C9374_003929 [Naegleria lovaniensis]|uniref:Fibrinogen C-terminal domain-containing protein n=1 Tax=Naegleria lovaniensis TaxID=51637 RepID=A0AA88KYM9_NAELO|nr:uncharacterized protein C9374_003929 [Naegleria lovaniensis]KAG2394165.1 hypothetical protein C9374_003929 [Naegleria lovaniensis]
MTTTFLGNNRLLQKPVWSGCLMDLLSAILKFRWWCVVGVFWWLWCGQWMVWVHASGLESAAFVDRKGVESYDFWILDRMKQHLQRIEIEKAFHEEKRKHENTMLESFERVRNITIGSWSASDMDRYRTLNKNRRYVLNEIVQDLELKKQVLQEALLMVSSKLLDLSLLNTCSCMERTTLNDCREEDQVVGDQILQTTNLESHNVFIPSNNNSALQNGYPKTCKEYLQRFGESPNGLYLVRPLKDLSPLLVYCDMEDGGWMYMNGFNSTETPTTNEREASPISFSTFEDPIFMYLYYMATEVRSSMGDSCVIDSSDPEPQQDVIMQKLCDRLSPTGQNLNGAVKYWIK